MLLDSPLNKAGLLQIYFRTTKNVLVEVSPQCRIPRTFDRFCGLMGNFEDSIYQTFYHPISPSNSHSFSSTSSQNVYPSRRNTSQIAERDQKSSFGPFASRLPQVLDVLQHRQLHDAEYICTSKSIFGHYRILLIRVKSILTQFQTVCQEKPDEPIAVVVGGIARGKIVTDYTEMDVKISNYPLSAALACAKLTTAFEALWGIE